MAIPQFRNGLILWVWVGAACLRLEGSDPYHVSELQSRSRTDWWKGPGRANLGGMNCDRDPGLRCNAECRTGLVRCGFHGGFAGVRSSFETAAPPIGPSGDQATTTRYSSVEEENLEEMNLGSLRNHV